jgi:hypothetical protein
MQSKTLRQPFALSVLMLVAALFFAVVVPAQATGTTTNELIDESQTQVSLSQVSKESYSFKVTGVLLNTNAKKVTVNLAGKSYAATIKSNKKEFTLQKRVTLQTPLPTTVQIDAVDHAGVTHTVLKEFPPLLVDASSLSAKKREFIGDEIYYYEITGKLLADVQTVTVIAGDTTKQLTVTSRSFKVSLFETKVKSIRVVARTADGKTQELEVKV